VKRPKKAEGPQAFEYINVVHEVDADAGRHRIVVITEGVPSAGSWAPHEVIATHKSGLRAATDHWEGIFPAKVFRAVTAGSKRLN